MNKELDEELQKAKAAIEYIVLGVQHRWSTATGNPLSTTPVGRLMVYVPKVDGVASIWSIASEVHCHAPADEYRAVFDSLA